MVAQKKKLQEEQLNQSQGSSIHCSSDDDEGYSFGENFIMRKLNAMMIPPTNRKLIYFNQICALAFMLDFFMTCFVIGNHQAITIEHTQDSMFLDTKLTGDSNFLNH